MAAKSRRSSGKVLKLKKADLAKAASVLLAELAKTPAATSTGDARANAGRRFLKEITRLTGALIADGCDAQHCGDAYEL